MQPLPDAPGVSTARTRLTYELTCMDCRTAFLLKAPKALAPGQRAECLCRPCAMARIHAAEQGKHD